jgi:hypothetical protein
MSTRALAERYEASAQEGRRMRRAHRVEDEAEGGDLRGE